MEVFFVFCTKSGPELGSASLLGASRGPKESKNGPKAALELPVGSRQAPPIVIQSRERPRFRPRSENVRFLSFLEVF